MESARVELLREGYRRFNARDVDALLELLDDDIEWPADADGTVLRDKDAIRAAWDAQFAEADPQLQPLDILEAGTDIVVAVDQRVHDHDGELVAPPAVVFHRYSFVGGKVRRMVVYRDRDAAIAGDPPMSARPAPG